MEFRANNAEKESELLKEQLEDLKKQLNEVFLVFGYLQFIILLILVLDFDCVPMISSPLATLTLIFSIIKSLVSFFDLICFAFAELLRIFGVVMNLFYG